MSFESRPMRRSRTQPPTTSARPPASCTTLAISFARSSESGMNRLASELFHNVIAHAWRKGIQPDQRARLEVGVHLGDWMLDRAGDRVGHLLRALVRTERALDNRAGLARHDVEELGLGRDGIDDAHVYVGANELRSEALGQSHLGEFRRRVRAHVRHPALADDRGDDDEMTAFLSAEERKRGARGEVGAEQIDVDELAHLVRSYRVNRTGDTKSGVADHHVETAEACDSLRDELLHLFSARDVGDDG